MQLRVGGMGSPFALDYGAVMAVAAARGANTEMIADVIPAFERAILGAIADDGGGADETDPSE